MLPAGLLSIGAIYICIIGFKETHQFSIPCNESLATVRPVSYCPMDEISFEKAAQNMSCATINNNCVRFEYHCVLNDYLNGTVEVCAPSLWVTGHVCTKFDSKLKSIFKTEDISCKNSTPSCGFRYNSTTLYNYRSCYNLSNIAKIIDKKLTNLKTTAVPPSTREILKTTVPVFSTSKLPTVFDKGEDEDKTAGNVVGIVLGAIFGVCVVVVGIVGSLVLCLKLKWRTQRRKRLPVKYTELKMATQSDKKHIQDTLDYIEVDGSPETIPLFSKNGDKEEKPECDHTDGGAKALENEKLPTSVSDMSPLPYKLMSQEQGIKEEQVTAPKTDKGASTMPAKQKMPRVLEPRNENDYPRSKPNYQDYQHDDKRARKSDPMSDHDRIGQLEQKFLYVDTELAEGRREREELKKSITTLEENIKKEKSEKEDLQEKIKELQIENNELKLENKDNENKIKELQKEIEEKDKKLTYFQNELHKLQKETEQRCDKSGTTRHKSY
ncbi:uncharacterized protein LOC134258372 [Saccostrea cucullata]|uniref:uncharacterized protein LOC134258372 n=1 Tax=Saccostrea cuccullata TaxID=36930 RepID=UPI002ED1E12A